jgi:hypothetical protein
MNPLNYRASFLTGNRQGRPLPLFLYIFEKYEQLRGQRPKEEKRQTIDDEPMAQII